VKNLISEPILHRVYVRLQALFSIFFFSFLARGNLNFFIFFYFFFFFFPSSGVHWILKFPHFRSCLGGTRLA
jgi:hypothetical protein